MAFRERMSSLFNYSSSEKGRSIIIPALLWENSLQTKLLICQLCDYKAEAGEGADGGKRGESATKKSQVEVRFNIFIKFMQRQKRLISLLIPTA